MPRYRKAHAPTTYIFTTYTDDLGHTKTVPNEPAQREAEIEKVEERAENARRYAGYREKQADRARAGHETKRDETARDDDNRRTLLASEQAKHPGWSLRRIVISMLEKTGKIPRVGEGEHHHPDDDRAIRKTYQQYDRLSQRSK